MGSEPALKSDVSCLADILSGALVWDNHACMPLRPQNAEFLPLLERVRATGVHVITLNLAYGNASAADAEAMARAFHAWIDTHPDDYLLVRSTGDLETARRSKRLGLCFDIEGMTSLDGNIENIERFRHLGVSWMLAAYNQSNAAAGGCLDADGSGLTAFGRRVISEMNRVGMICCGSHTSYRAAREMIDLSADPVIFSHSNPRAVWDHPRNIPDDLMKACAERGGVIGLNGFGPFLGPNDARTDIYVRHVEYALDLVGEDHVGIALDYVFDRDELDAYITSDPETFPPHLYAQGAEMIAPWRLPEIALALHARGHPTSRLARLFGGNHARIAAAVWR